MSDGTRNRRWRWAAIGMAVGLVIGVVGFDRVSALVDTKADH